MKNNTNNNQNVGVVTEETTHTVNRKAMLFISLSIIIPVIIEEIGVLILAILGADYIERAILSAIVCALELILVLVFSSKLTNNRTQAVHFIGIYGMGNILGTVVSSTGKFILDIFFPSTSIPPVAPPWIQYTVLLVATMTSVIFTCILYNRLIEKNTLHCVSFVNFSDIRKNMILAYICIFLAIVVLTCAIGIIPVLESARIIPEGVSSSDFIFVLSDFISTITLIATFGILYLFGFRHNKNRDDALNFVSCYYFPSVFTVAVTSVLSVIMNLVEVNPSAMATITGAIVSALTSVISIALFVAEILIVFRVLRQIFPIQQTAPMPFPAEETYTDDFYVEPSHIENAQIQKIDIKKLSNDDSEQKN